MSDKSNEILYISDSYGKVTIKTTSINRFIDHIDSYTNEVLTERYTSKNDILYKWNIRS